MKVKPVGKLVSKLPYVSTIDWISVAVPVTTNSILFKLWKAVALVSQVEVSVLSKLVPDNAPMYSSQVSWIFSLAAFELAILPIYFFTEITSEFVLVIKDLTLSGVSVTVIPLEKLSAIKFWEVRASISANVVKSEAVKVPPTKLEDSCNEVAAVAL